MGEMRHLFKATLDAVQYSFTKMTSLHITFLTSMQKLLYGVDKAQFLCWISKEKEHQEAQPNIYGNLYPCTVMH